MRIEFLDSSQESSRSGGSGKRSALGKESKDNGLFWWTILITLLLGVATFSWFFSVYVFSHPEKPFNYRLLSKLDRLESIEKFDQYSIPKGKALKAKEVYERNFNFKSSHLKVKNSLLKRAYLSNYQSEQPVYIRGKYQVRQVRGLTEKDPLTTGFVLRARSVEYPTVSIEYILPTSEKLTISQAPYQVGDTFEISSKRTYASVLHIEKEPQEQLCVSVLSLVYPEMASLKLSESSDAGEKTLELAPPSFLNLEGAWPLTISGLLGSEESQKVAKAVPYKAKRS